ncbi:SDR family NAD(P)-dependent oxidoreductase [Streptomyces sp. NPDC046977]|uniref:SDR family NAD(P)-dependent oxidoreductase n=1 Tax=Streptomyces sp. NPDC046977 TaxID=3154703 RepID=UPI0033D64A6E
MSQTRQPGPHDDVPASPPAPDEHTVTAPHLRALLREWVSQCCAVEVQDIHDDRPMAEYGLTSRDAVGLSGRLEELLDRRLSSTLLWENPTIEQLVAALADGTGSASPKKPDASPAPAGGPGADLPVAHAPAGPLGPRPGADPDTSLIAVVGIGCRLPGGMEGPDRLWEGLLAGRDAISSVPDRRWRDFDDGSAGTAEVLARTTRWGGFLEDIAAFDADFFGITPREAEIMDPQQRLLLEVAWEALDHAGMAAGQLGGSRTGVFVGLSSLEYGHLTTADPAAVTAWTSTGAAGSIAANRLSYLLDVHGPSMTIDTACSSSLVAVHQACRGLRSGECDAALVGGVNVLLSPTITAAFDQAGALAADGRCKTFDAAADGIARGEGCAVVVLKRLADARRDNDTVWAVVRGSAVNSDGRSAGLMAPNPAAQEQVLRAALHDAAATAGDIDYVEAHGTGTLLGDPIEAGALSAVLGQGRPADRPLLIGSVKTNIGHLEGAAGLVGLVKTALSLHHGVLPPSLHFHTPNPHIDFAACGLRVVTDPTPYPVAGSRPAMAGVSAFGFGGTNAHVILAAPDTTGETTAPPRDDARAAKSAEQDHQEGTPHVLVVSARSAARVPEAAGALADWLHTPAGRQTDLRDLAHTLATQRRGPAVGAVVGRERAELIRLLRDLARDQHGPATVAPHRQSEPTAPLHGEQPPGPVFVFSGYGSQWQGMGRQLLQQDRAFAAEVAAMGPAFTAVTGTTLTTLVEQGAEAARVDQTQPLLFGLQVALARTWQAYGIEPAAVIGHSMGEVGAAVVAGALDLEDGLRLMVHRSSALAAVDGAGGGAMAAIELPEDVRLQVLQRYPGVQVAVHSSPRRCTVTGPADEVAALVGETEQAGYTARTLAVSGAGHSAAVDPALPVLREQLAALQPRPAVVTWYSTVDDDPAAPVWADAAYWCRNIRRPVRLQQAVTAAAQAGHTLFVEISPHPVAALPISETLQAVLPHPGLVLPTLRRDGDEAVDLRTSLAAAHLAQGHTGNQLLWPAAQRVAIPSWPWRHSRYWVPGRPAASRRTGGHPVLGRRINIPGTDRIVWHADAGTGGWNRIKRSLHGTPVLTLAASAHMMLAAAEEGLAASTGDLVVRDLALDQLLPLTDSTPVTVVLEPTDTRTADITLHTQSPAGTWLCHARATVCSEALPPPSVPLGPDDLPVTQIPADAAPQSQHSDSQTPAARLALLDAALTAPAFVACAPSTATATAQPASKRALFPTAAARVHLTADAPGADTCQVYCMPAVTEPSCCPHRHHADGFDMTAVTGEQRVLHAHAVTLQAPDRSQVPRSLHETAYEIVWTKAALPVTEEAFPAQWLLLTSAGTGSFHDSRFAAPLAAALEAHGGTVTTAAYQPATVADLLHNWDPGAAGVPRHVVLLFTDEPAPQETGMGQAVRAAADLARHLAASDAVDTSTLPRLWLVTERAQQVTAEEYPDPDRAALTGLVRVLALEHPAMHATVVDVDRDPNLADDLSRELLAASEADQVAWRGGTRFLARLASADPDASPALSPSRFARPDGAYIITGGLSGLGLATARRLAEQGAGRIVLNGRRPASQATLDAVADMRAGGTQVEIALGDIAEPATAGHLVRVAEAEGHTLAGVAHAAGVLRDRPVTELTAADLDLVLSVKAEGSRHLHHATREHSLDWWVLFSSAAALTGSPGQAAYAAANAFMDALARWRHADGLPAISIAWGPWADIGAAPATARLALDPLEQTQGMDALQLLLAQARPHLGVLCLDPQRLAAAFPGLKTLPYFTDLLRTDTSADHHWPGPDALRTMGEAAYDTIRQRLIRRAAAVMGYDGDHLDPAVPLTELGLDSLMTVRIQNAVRQDFGIVLPASLALRGATLRDLVEAVIAALDLPAPATTDSTMVAPSSGTEQPPDQDQDRKPPTALAPRDAAERLVASVYQQVTGEQAPGVLQDLPAAHDPRTATALAEAITARLPAGTAAPAAPDLLRRPTVAGIADLLRPAVNAGTDAEVNVLNPPVQDHRAPLFLFHPAGGPTSVYRPLVQLLAGDRPVYGLERLDSATTMEDKARHYQRVMRDLWPSGPYHMLGWSFGGCLAYEVARQLDQDGQEPGFLGLIDTILPAALPGLDSQQLLIDRFERFVQYIEATYGRRVRLPYQELASVSDDEQIDVVLREVAAAGCEMSPAIVEHQRTSYLDARVGERYRPRPYAGPTVLYRAQDPQPLTTALDPRYLRQEADLGWASLCPALQIVLVTGDHLSMIDPPHVAIVARHLNATLNDKP